jgi:5-methylcytosine-specific restriction endonuclease McrA
MDTRLLRSIRNRLAAKQGGKCHYCRCTMTACDGCSPSSVTLDHVVPLALGGPNLHSNMVASCYACNQAKADTPPDVAIVKQAKPRKKTKAKSPPADLHIQQARAAAKMAQRRQLGRA